MSYGDFTLLSVIAALNLSTETGDLFGQLESLRVPDWLVESLAEGRRQALVSEKARSEFLVAPILLAGRKLTSTQVSIFSGQRLDVCPEKGLQGECDFILATASTAYLLGVPVLTIVEAKKNDIEVGLGQCIAQMAGSQMFNQQAGIVDWAVYGCVTTGEDWQFLKLKDQHVTIDANRFYIDSVGQILAVLQTIIKRSGT